MSYAPLLNLAPRREKPLSLLNPLDYLQLLYWIFFFPQAVAWYVEHFTGPTGQGRSGNMSLQENQRRNRIRRNLGIQAITTLVVTQFFLIWVLSGYKVTMLFYIVALGVLYGSVEVFKGMRTQDDDAHRMAHGVVYGVVLGVVSAVLLAPGAGFAINIPTFAFGDTVGDNAGMVIRRCLLAGLVLVVSLVVARSFALRTTTGMARATMSGSVDTVQDALISSLKFGAMLGLGWGVEFRTAANYLMESGDLQLDTGTMVGAGLPVGAIAGLLAFLCISRIPDWLVSWPIRLWRGGRWFGSHLVWLPLPGGRRQLEGWLRQDWTNGLRNIRQILEYTQQLIPAAAAVNSTLARTPGRLLISRVSSLAQGREDGELLYFGSVNIEDHLRHEAIRRLTFLPERWTQRWRSPFHLRTDSPARAACAGFWAWYKEDPVRAMNAFSVIKDLPQGRSLYDFNGVMVTALRISSLKDLATWKNGVMELERFSEPELRPGAHAALGQLREVSNEVARALAAGSSRDRSVALGQANSMLTVLHGTMAKTCPYPERSLIEKIAGRWQEKVSLAGGSLGEEMISS